MNVATIPDITSIPDIASAAFFADRYPMYRALRDHFPLFHTEIDGEPCIMLTRYADVDEALRNPLVTIHAEPGKFPEERIGQGPASRFYRESLPSLDPPDHTRIRRILTPAFTSRAIGEMHGWVEAVTERHLAKLDGKSEVDFVAAVASPIAAEVACKLAHVPITDAHELISRVHELISRVHELIVVLGASSMTSGALETADAAGHFCYAYMEDLLDTLKRTKLPADDPVGVLLAAEGHKNGVTRSELTTLHVGHIVTGYHTTRTAMTNATLALLRHPDQKARLIAQPELARSAWEEVLRYDGSVHFRHRYASGPITIGGTRIEPGQRLLLGLQAANRDERRFPEPDRFIINRLDNRHLGFGSGPHVCLGAHLSRLEGEILLQRLFQRFPQMHIKDVEPDPIRDLSFPTIKRLTVSLR